MAAARGKVAPRGREVAAEELAALAVTAAAETKAGRAADLEKEATRVAVVLEAG